MKELRAVGGQESGGGGDCRKSWAPIALPMQHHGERAVRPATLACAHEHAYAMVRTYIASPIFLSPPALSVDLGTTRNCYAACISVHVYAHLKLGRGVITQWTYRHRDFDCFPEVVVDHLTQDKLQNSYFSQKPCCDPQPRTQMGGEEGEGSEFLNSLD